MVIFRRRSPLGANGGCGRDVGRPVDGSPRRRRGVGLLVQQRHQRIDRRQRVEVEHHPVAELAHRLQREQLGGHFFAQVEHDAQHVGRLLAEADPRNVRVARRHARGELLQFGCELDRVEVEHDPRGILQADETVRHRRVRLEDEPGVFLRGPDARRGDAAGGAERLERDERSRDRNEQRAQRAPPPERKPGYAVRPWGCTSPVIAFRHRSPASVRASSTQLRPSWSGFSG